MKKGFTLIELLVVVLIIGILSAIALPQYRVAVEKAKLTEALQNIRILEEQAKLYLLENGMPSNTIIPGYVIPNTVNLVDISSVELSGGEWEEGVYNTQNFSYYANISSVSGINIEVTRNSPSCYYQLRVMGTNPNALAYDCFNGSGNEMGSKICHMLESSGWQYQEGEF